MAYVTQADKKELAPAIKAVLKKYNLKGSISINHHSKLVVTMKSGSLDFMTDFNQQNKVRMERQGREYYGDCHHFSVSYTPENGDEKIKAFFGEMLSAMKKKDWRNNSDSMTDYFDISYFVEVSVGKWDAQYKLI